MRGLILARGECEKESSGACESDDSDKLQDWRRYREVIDEVSGMDGNARRGKHGWDNWHHRQGVRKTGCREPKKKRHRHSMSI